MFGVVQKFCRRAYALIVAFLPPRWHVMLAYTRAHGRLPNLRHPKTFNEKIAWRKLYERDERFPNLIDKIRVKEFVGSRYGYHLIIPTIAIYNDPLEMNFADPPLNMPPYVIKCSHGCGMNVFVKDSSLDKAAIVGQLAGWLKINHYDSAEEWAYSFIKPRILVEPYLGNLTDYKFHIFSGKVYAIETVLDRFTTYFINFYTPDWELLNITKYAGRPQSHRLVPPPKNLKAMLKLAEDIGRRFSYLRLDLYEVADEVKLGELTFYSGASLDRFEPPEWDWKFGQQWKQLGRVSPSRSRRTNHDNEKVSY